MLVASNLQKEYPSGTGTLAVLRNVSFSVPQGSLVAIVGPSGSGKTTLLGLLAGLDVPSSGSVSLDGVDITHMSEDERARLRGEKVGFIFQTFQLLPKETALANVELPLVYRGLGSRERRERAVAALEKVGLSHRMHHRPNELSGGQRQRVAIARALCAEPSMLLADEPTGNLDSATGEEIVRLFEALHQAGHTLVLVTHEPRLAARCPRAVRLSDGRVVADGPGPEVARQNLEDLQRAAS